MDVAYEIFDGKYTAGEIENMPYKILLERLERESETYKNKSETRAQKKMVDQLGI